MRVIVLAKCAGKIKIYQYTHRLKHHPQSPPSPAPFLAPCMHQKTIKSKTSQNRFTGRLEPRLDTRIRGPIQIAPRASQAPFQARQVLTSCAVCASEILGEVVRQPIGRDDAMVPVCAECDTGAIVARCDMRGIEATDRSARRKAPDPLPIPGSFGRRLSPAIASRSPGFELVRVAVTGPGWTRDEDEARETFAHEPWAAEANYLSCDGHWHLFERPPTRTAVKPEQPLAGIEQWRTR